MIIYTEPVLVASAPTYPASKLDVSAETRRLHFDSKKNGNPHNSDVKN